MAGNRAGGLKIAEQKKIHDPGFYRRIGAIGGRNGNTGGFAARRDLARSVGSLGGKARWRKHYEKLNRENTLRPEVDGGVS